MPQATDCELVITDRALPQATSFKVEINLGQSLRNSASEGDIVILDPTGDIVILGLRHR